MYNSHPIKYKAFFPLKVSTENVEKSEALYVHNYYKRL